MLDLDEQNTQVENRNLYTLCNSLRIKWCDNGQWKANIIYLMSAGSKNYSWSNLNEFHQLIM